MFFFTLLMFYSNYLLLAMFLVWLYKSLTPLDPPTPLLTPLNPDPRWPLGV
jgi:hypothetical protein